MSPWRDLLLLYNILNYSLREFILSCWQLLWKLQRTFIGMDSHIVTVTWKWKSLSHVRLFATPWTIQSNESSRPEYWSWGAFLVSRGTSQSRDQTPNPSHPHCRYFLLYNTKMDGNKCWHWTKWYTVFIIQVTQPKATSILQLKDAIVYSWPSIFTDGCPTDREYQLYYAVLYKILEHPQMWVSSGVLETVGYWGTTLFYT